jgi:hypothetical protein
MKLFGALISSVFLFYACLVLTAFNYPDGSYGDLPNANKAKEITKTNKDKKTEQCNEEWIKEINRMIEFDIDQGKCSTFKSIDSCVTPETLGATTDKLRLLGYSVTNNLNIESLTIRWCQDEN